jgi:hypothetical protein
MKYAAGKISCSKDGAAVFVCSCYRLIIAQLVLGEKLSVA